MTNTCQLKRGFFVMRSCPAPAVRQCTGCKRGVCQHHSAANTTTCVECAKNTSDEYYNDYWVYSYRDQYYREGYEPFKYNEEDYVSFETYDDGGEIWDEDYSGDFHDS